MYSEQTFQSNSVICLGVRASTFALVSFTFSITLWIANLANTYDVPEINLPYVCCMLL